MNRATHLKVKIDSLTAEARIIRRYQRKALERAKRGSMEAVLTHESLYLHRVQVVRRESRCAHLAQAFMRGQDYAVVERPHSSRPDYSHVWELIKRFGQPMVEHKCKSDLESWFGLIDGAIR